MSFIFLNDAGQKLSANDFLQLTSGLNEPDNEITIKVRNNSTVDANEPVIFLMPSSDLGTVDYPSKYPTRTDWNDLLLWGSTLDDQGANTAGLYYKDIDSEITYFSLNAGSNYQNGIPLGLPISADGSIDITLGFTPKAGDNTRRLYVGVEIYDSRTNI
tara:strand:- start:51944 stop:52420 length:477 start_codon:yes stop_codon:yes gene_type:complete